MTATEVNNYGFNIERRDSGGVPWDSIGFVAGHGTSNSPHEYTYIDSSLLSSLYYYRLKQVNNDRSFNYSLSVEVVITTTGIVSENPLILNNLLHLQNYPNPFNPSTIVKFMLMSQANISLKIFDFSGREVTVLFIGKLSKGNHSFEWNASKFASGIYFARLRGENINQTQKLILQR